MARWQDIQEFARKHYTLYEDQEDFFSVYWRFDGGRTQRIVVNHFQGYGQPWLQFRTWVCEGAAMLPNVALRKNDNFIVGALGMDSDGDYVLRYSVPLNTLDLEEFELPLEALARSADRMEEEFSVQDRF